MSDSISPDVLDENISQLTADHGAAFNNMVATRSGKRTSGAMAPPAKRPARLRSEPHSDTAMPPPPRPSSLSQPGMHTGEDTPMSFEVPQHEYVHTAQFDAMSARSTRQSDDIRELREMVQEVKKVVDSISSSHNIISSAVAVLSSRMSALEAMNSKRDDNESFRHVRSAAEILSAHPISHEDPSRLSDTSTDSNRQLSGGPSQVVVAHGKPRRPRPV